MKHAGYREAVAWIADNDNPGSDDDIDSVAGYVTTLLVADLFGKEPQDVAKAIMRRRAKAATL